MFKIISDSACDFSEKEAKEQNIQLIPFYISLDGETFLKEGVDIQKKEYFEKLRSDKKLFPKTSQPSPQDYIDALTPHLSNGEDVLVFTISSHLSGSNQSAVNASKILGEEFPQRQIIIIDSLSGCIGQGIILREIIRMRDAGLDVLKAKEITEKIIKDTTDIYFTPDTLEYLKKGGRIGAASALVGGLLNLRPILHILNGKAEPLDKVRGRKNAMKIMKETLTKVLGEEKNSFNVSVGHILSEPEALEFKSSIEETLEIKIDNPLTDVGATVGTHIGPGALAVSYCKKYESFL